MRPNTDQLYLTAVALWASSAWAEMHYKYLGRDARMALHARARAVVVYDRALNPDLRECVERSSCLN